MSNKELDSLFKKKLEQLEQKPSANAWDKVQAQTGGKSGAGWPWMRIAAAILLLMTSGVVIWYVLRQPEEQMQIADRQTGKPDIEKRDKTNVVDSRDNEAVVDNQEKEVQPAVEENTTSNNNIAQKESVKQPIENTTVNKAPAAKEEKKTIPAEQPEVLETMDNTNNIASAEVPDATIEEQPASDNGSEMQGTTLEFDLSDFEKTAVAANTESRNNEEEKNAKGVGKVLNLMKEIKSEAGLGDLREAKNEIFAFNFKKDDNGSK